MDLTREEIEAVLHDWNLAWDGHDLDGVMALFHDQILFENWTGGRATGKEALRKAWSPWFAHHGGFRFVPEDTFIDETTQQVLFQWRFEGPSLEKGHEGRTETRRGVDVLRFRDGKIIQKLTYSKTTIEIDGSRISLHG